MPSQSFYLYRKQLPHWRQEGATYFVTWRLHKTQPDLAPDDRTLIAAALRHFDGARYRLWSYVVMNDHVHVLLMPLAAYELQTVVQNWKSYTAHQLTRAGGRSAPVWQDEYLDRIVRNEDEYFEKFRYILGNPWKRWPGMEDYPWVWMRQE